MVVIVELSVEYVGTDAGSRSATHYAFLRADDLEAAYDLADHYAQYLSTDEGGGYIAAEAMQVGEVMGELPPFVTVHTAADIPAEA